MMENWAAAGGRVAGSVLRGPSRDVHRHRARGGGGDGGRVARIVALQFRDGAIADDQVLKFEAGHRFGRKRPRSGRGRLPGRSPRC